jgi:hypothetical protein
MRHKGKVGLGGWEIGRFKAGIGTGSELPERYTQFSRNRGGESLPVPIPAMTGWISMPRRPLKARISFCGAIHLEPTEFRIAIGARGLAVHYGSESAAACGPLDTPITGNEKVKITPETEAAWLVAYLPEQAVTPESVRDALLGFLESAPVARASQISLS